MQDLDWHKRQVIHRLRIDHLIAEIANMLAEHRIETIVLKGPALAAWLYPDEARVYSDADLLVAPNDWERADRLLERAGFSVDPRWIPATQFSETHAKPFQRDRLSVDLHRALPGLDGNPQAVWDSLRVHAELQQIAGVQLKVPDRGALLLHIALHAAHHAGEPGFKVFDDLRRAIATADESQWQQAFQLAQAHDGVPAFATGLRLAPEAHGLMLRFGLGGTRSLRHELRGQGGVIAEELGSLLLSERPTMERLRTVMHELFPRPTYMRHWSTLARRGRLGLVAAYAWRPLWTIAQLPSATRTVWRVARTATRTEDT
jgi:hypothetical protein